MRGLATVPLGAAKSR